MISLSHSSFQARLIKKPAALLGLFILAFLLLMALIGPSLSPYEYTEIHLDWKNKPPSTQFWFGTDELGRDLFSRVCWGARISLFIGITAALIDAIIGVIFGATAAYLGGKIEEMMTRFADILYTIPYLLVVILLTVVRGTGIVTILIAMTLTGWINMARIVRAQILQLKSEPYVLSARLIGASFPRILRFHLVPNMLGPILATLTLTIPAAIFTEAFLSFLGLGVQAPAASWGVMVNDGLAAMRYYPWRLLFPSLMISLTTLGFNLVGNSLSSLLEPRSRR